MDTSIVVAREDQMPVTYQRAKTALAECSSIDEVKEWRDKSLALSVYAKQANDNALLEMANRIKARAVHRMGELFNQIEPQSRAALRQGGTSPSEIGFGREQAARDAGISQDQRKQAQKIAEIPRDEFDEILESSAPTLTDLEQRARGNPAAMRATSSLLGEAKHFAKFCSSHDPMELVPALAGHERAAIMEHAKIIVDWLSRLAKEIGQ